MHGLNRQRGLLGLGWIVVIAVVGIVIVTAFKLIPLYYDDRIVDKVLQEIARDPASSRLTGPQLWSLIDQRLSLNSVYGIDAQNFSYTKKDGHRTVAINYDARMHLIGNLDLLAVFSRSVELRQPE